MLIIKVFFLSYLNKDSYFEYGSKSRKPPTTEPQNESEPLVQRKKFRNRPEPDRYVI